MFQAFSNLLRRGRDEHVVVDTAPTGHTLMLLDRTGAYHRDVMRTSTEIQGRITTPLMRLRDAAFTRVLIVTLAETTPVHEAAALQADLQRSGIEPYGWIVNASLSASGTRGSFAVPASGARVSAVATDQRDARGAVLGSFRGANRKRDEAPATCGARPSARRGSGRSSGARRGTPQGSEANADARSPST